MGERDRRVARRHRADFDVEGGDAATPVGEGQAVREGTVA
jgi:hypothetical protein